MTVEVDLDLFIFGQIQNYLVYRYFDLTCFINDKLIFGPS
jgi:hypothetical protein